MPRQLPFDCIGEILENLEEDKVTLYSCLLVNRLWCRTSVEILWRDIWNRKTKTNNRNPNRILYTLISCLPYESKDLLYKEGVDISPLTSNPPLFDYASFFKALSIEGIVIMLDRESIISPYNQSLILHELLKMFMNQISSLKILAYEFNFNAPYETITDFPGAKDCLKDLSRLICSSDIHSEFLLRLSQICHNIRSLNIVFNEKTSNELNDLISSQINLKYLSLTQTSDDITLGGILPSIMKHSDTLIKLSLTIKYVETLSFITGFTNLQELDLSFENVDFPFYELTYAYFPHLQILKISYESPEVELLIKFLEINGKNLTEFSVIESDDSLNLAIAQFCPNMKVLSTIFKKKEMETLKIIFKSCKRLESIDSWYGDEYLDLTVMLKIVVNHSPENFRELILRIYFENPKLLPKDLESFFSNWKILKPQQSISITIIKNSGDYYLYNTKKHMKVIEKYTNLGVVKKFEWQQGFGK